MCKKTVYIIPEIRVVMVQGEVLMSASGGTGATGVCLLRRNGMT